MLKGILAISGQSGLFKLVAESKNSIIVESMDTNKRFPVHSTTKVSSLEDISVFTQEGDLSLSKVFKAISDKEKGGLAVSHKLADKELKSYFMQVLPEYDRNRVYVSDIKKIIMWYNILVEKQLLEFPEETEQEAVKEESAENAASE
jgi:hypothetical protein